MQKSHESEVVAYLVKKKMVNSVISLISLIIQKTLITIFNAEMLSD